MCTGSRISLARSSYVASAERPHRIAQAPRSSALFVLLLYGCAVAAAPPLTWVVNGPGPNTRGQVENIKDGEVVGAIKAVAPHPSDANVIYLGAVNGGIWKTTNAMAATPTWVHQTDDQESLSIGALEFDPTDATTQTLVAGVGRFSSLGGVGGVRAGLLRTANGGATWVPIGGGGALGGLNVSGVAPRGDTLVLAANAADNFAKVGIWRSTNAGASWTRISGAPGTGLPAGASSELASDPKNPDRLFSNAGTAGLYRSDNAGATWTKVSDAAMDALIAQANNIKVTVGRHDNVYVAIVNAGRLAGVFRSGNGGANWAALDLPETAEGGIHPGAQGGVHLSIAADPGDDNLVYVGGDRQPDTGDESHPFPNSIGARDYSGRLFRGDASKPSGHQWVHLTHSSSLGAPGGGTASGSAPHADSRGLRFAANGMLLEVDDGGIYRRSSPRTNTGDWFSLNGDLETTEFHAVAWDANSHTVVGGAQDTGTPEQQQPGKVRWQSVTTGDGGVVAVDDTSTPGLSVRYSSYYDFWQFRRQVYDAHNVLQSQVLPPLTVLGGGSPLTPQFYTPIKVNAVAPTRLVIGADNSVYESLDQGDTITEIGPGIRVNGTGPNPIAYGASANPDMLYVGAGARVFVRTAASPAALVPSAAYTGGTVLGIALDPNDPQSAFVIDPKSVYRTANTGGSWTDLTANLPALAPGSLRAVAYSTADPAGAVVVGGDAGVFVAPGPAFSAWSRLGTGLPRAPVFHAEYNARDRVLLAGTLGRGAWTLAVAAGAPAADQPGDKRAPGQPPAAPESKDMNALQLAPGVIVDQAHGHAYVMTPGGGIDAVELAEGKVVWQTKEAAKPLGVKGDRLVGQAEPAGAANKLRLVALDTATGKPVVSGSTDLPAGVKASINEGLGGRFLARARVSEGDVLVSWQYVERRKRGLPPGTPDALPPGEENAPPRAPADVASNGRSGTVRMDLSTGTTSPAHGAEANMPRVPQAVELPVAERVPGILGAQFPSVDGRHVLVSKRTGDDREWDKYTWSVFDRGTGKPMGEFRTHLALAPFFVTDTRLLYETGPYVRRTEKNLVEEPPRLRAIDLNTGKELWSREVRDTTYRGPLPP